MRYFIPIYGFKVHGELEFGPFIIESLDVSQDLVIDTKSFHMSAYAELIGEESQLEELIFRLGPILSFLQQQWVHLAENVITVYEDHMVVETLKKLFPDKIPIIRGRKPPQILIASQDIQRVAIALDQVLQDDPTNKCKGFHQAFYRYYRLLSESNRLIETSYYLLYTGLDILARSYKDKYTDTWGPIATLLKDLNFIRGEGVKEIVGFFLDARNHIFHYGLADFVTNERDCRNDSNTVPITVYEGQMRKKENLLMANTKLEKLLPLVLLRFIACEPLRTNFNAWFTKDAWSDGRDPALDPIEVLESFNITMYDKKVKTLINRWIEKAEDEKTKKELAALLEVYKPKDTSQFRKKCSHLIGNNDQINKLFIEMEKIHSTSFFIQKIRTKFIIDLN